MAYKKLLDGFSLFKKDYFHSKKGEAYQKLVAEGQKPETLVIACSDSRIDPAILTYSDPGEFFAVRNVAALVPPYNNGGLLRGTSSAIEYAVRFLQVKHIVILGHAGCGGIGALATGNFQVTEYHNFEFLHHWLGIASEAKEQVFSVLSFAGEKQRTKALEQASILVSLENLRSFPWIKDKYERQELQIHGWYFDMKEGQLLEYNVEKGLFEDIRQDQAKKMSSLPSAYDLSRFLKKYAQTCACSQ
ncbi:MAG: carbonic anhydrase [Rhodospirillales bacterium]|nr:carbonic anhydrase [Alphaproteobacteria bacterium]USO06449.1 MAG: carbonic anhydrase [Rhodospirillales bacterium]